MGILDMSWVWLGVGATTATISLIVAHKISNRAVVRNGEDDMPRTDAELWKGVLPGKISVGVAAIAVAASTTHLCITSIQHLGKATILACVAVGAGHAVDTVVGDVTVRIPLPGRWWRDERVGTLVRNGGLSLTGMWLTSRMAQEMACFVIVTGISALPLVHEVSLKVNHNRQRLVASVGRGLRLLQQHADANSIAYQGELHQLWETHGFADAVEVSECLQLLLAFTHHRSREIEVNIAGLAVAVGMNRGAAHGVGMATGGGLTFVMKRWVLLPWADANRTGTITKNECLALYDRCVVEVLGGIAGNVEQGFGDGGGAGFLQNFFVQAR
eukprot:m.88678 g.88678  ORF g.88678 m.88678 type:complete len:329 (-) comp26223_c0_seq2:46-1032(-)